MFAFSCVLYVYITISFVSCVLVSLYPLNELVYYRKFDCLVLFPAENIAAAT